MNDIYNLPQTRILLSVEQIPHWPQKEQPSVKISHALRNQAYTLLPNAAQLYY